MSRGENITDGRDPKASLSRPATAPSMVTFFFFPRVSNPTLISCTADDSHDAAI
jgi:hypothetical protein